MNRLRLRLLLLGIVPLVIILPVVIFASTTLLRSQIILNNLLNDYSRQALLVSELLANRPDIWQNRRLAQDVLARMAEIIPTRLLLFDSQGELIASSDPGDILLLGTHFEFPSHDEEFSRTNVVIAQVGSDEGLLVTVYDIPNNLQGFVFLSTPFAEIARRTKALVWILLATGGAGLILGVLLALGLTQDLERPLKRLSQTAYMLALGELCLNPSLKVAPKNRNYWLVRSMHSSNAYKPSKPVANACWLTWFTNWAHPLEPSFSLFRH